VLCELLNTISFPKSEEINRKIRAIKLSNTKKNWKKDKKNIFLLRIFIFFKSFNDVIKINTENINPKIIE
tara:strand:+ start:24 stop:233 length:210 start_codon:yes stop_codon:yes gene_type:complete